MCDPLDFQFVKGPKVKSDIIECWRVMALRISDNKKVEITSAFTMGELAHDRFRVVPNKPDSELYGDFVIELGARFYRADGQTDADAVCEKCGRTYAWHRTKKKFCEQ